MLESTGMLGTPGFLAKVFDVLGREDVDIDMISTSEVSLSMTCDGESKLNGAIRELDKLGQVTVVTEKSIVCIVGKNVKHQQGLGALIFSALHDADVNVEMISQGANKINISLLIDDKDVKSAIPALHAALFK
jgi:aspartate kinase